MSLTYEKVAKFVCDGDGCAHTEHVLVGGGMPKNWLAREGEHFCPQCQGSCSESCLMHCRRPQ